MSARSIGLGMVTTVIGALAAVAAYWALLNVPESNVLALVLSAVLVLTTAVVVGWTTGAVLALASGHSIGTAAARGLRTFPRFVVGLVLFAVLWWITAAADAWWTQHRGEVDATLISAFGMANDAWVHVSFGWALWLVRWAIGLSVLVAVMASGLPLSAMPLPLLAAIAALSAGRLAWRVVYWRPRALPSGSVELVFVATKLAVLSVLAALVYVLVLHVFASGRRRRTPMRT